ncbi:unnamed protein product [Caenorhabditis sp. 36 PRJEB53466]|nr:unnamed protein product [Caenorhabditis sp. 36 PRJEB53466]
MSNELTVDDAISDATEQQTQIATKSENATERTQDETAQTARSDREAPAKNVQAQMVDEDFEGADLRFRAPAPVKFEEKELKKLKKSKKKSKKQRILKWKRVDVELIRRKKVEKTILSEASGRALGGQLTFIMGSSGAGKTTLLNVLTGRNKSGLAMSGEITLNGRLLDASDLKRISAYVQQEDVFIASQTVSEVLHFAVEMRSPKVLPREERARLVEHMLSTFGLKKCEHTRIGSLREKGISRGEKKRLAFACEILTDPPILFCDEPTSGLDSYMSLQAMRCLKALAAEGMIVVCTVHQPSTWVWQMADRLILMCQGRVAYDGAARNVERFLQRIGSPLPPFASVSDHFIRVLSRAVDESKSDYDRRMDRILRRQKTCTESPAKSESETRKTRRTVAARTWCFQFCALTRRGLVQISRRKKYILARLILTVLVSWFLGMVYLQVPIHKDHILGIKGVIFATLQMNNILYMMPSLISFWDDYPVVVREYQSNMYSPSAYFMARSFTDSLLHLGFPLIFFGIIYSMTGLPVTAIGMSTFLVMCIAMSMIITSLSHAVVSLCGNVTMSMMVAPLISVPVMVFGGFLITVDAVPWYYKPLSYVSWYHYAFEAIMIAFFKDIGPIDGCNQKVNPQFDIECSTGLKLIHDQDFAVGHFYWDFVAVAAILVFWKIFGLFAFVCRIRKMS